MCWGNWVFSWVDGSVYPVPSPGLGISELLKNKNKHSLLPSPFLLLEYLLLYVLFLKESDRSFRISSFFLHLNCLSSSTCIFSRFLSLSNIPWLYIWFLEKYNFIFVIQCYCESLLCLMICSSFEAVNNFLL